MLDLKHMNFNLITIFPQIFDSYLAEGVLGRAIKNKIIKVGVINLRDYSTDKRKTVDDTVYGGGAGMLMKIEPLVKALGKIKSDKVYLLSAKGKRFNQQIAKKLTKFDNVTLICGRYEGVDERIKHFIDGEISIGDYVLSGGEIGAMAIVDAVSRLLPGVLGNSESLISESHSQAGVLEYPQYTKPAKFLKYSVPKVLLSGDHGAIDQWKISKQKKLK